VATNFLVVRDKWDLSHRRGMVKTLHMMGHFSQNRSACSPARSQSAHTRTHTLRPCSPEVSSQLNSSDGSLQGFDRDTIILRILDEKARFARANAEMDPSDAGGCCVRVQEFTGDVKDAAGAVLRAVEMSELDKVRVRALERLGAGDLACH
jgi:hypothetical protein